MKIKVDAYSLSPSSVLAGIKGSQCCESLFFEFDALWEGFAKKVIFSMPDGTSLIKTYGGGALKIPDAVLAKRGKTQFAIVGRKGKQRRISVCGTLMVLNSLSDLQKGSEEAK